jgi:hypothetical protein
MSVNYELHYLSAFCYVNSEGYNWPRKKAVLTPKETEALQHYAKWSTWENPANQKGGFSNEPTYALYTMAEEVKWYECFTSEEQAEIRLFLAKFGYDEVLKEMPSE